MIDARWPRRRGLLFLLTGVTCVASAMVTSCGVAPTPFVVTGPGSVGNEPPTLSIDEPTANITADQGSLINISWSDSDRDSNAQIIFVLINTVTNGRINVTDPVDENDDTGQDSISFSTGLIPVGTYHLQGIIDDGENPPVEVFAFTTGDAVAQRVVVRIVEPGQGGQLSVPPTLTVIAPAFDLSVAQDDVLTVVVRPTAGPDDPNFPFDPDSQITMFIVADVDLDPNNDDPANPDPSQIIVLQERQLEPGDFATQTFNIVVDLTTIPARPNGDPYFIRATVDDRTNPRVHEYAVGTISVVQLAAGIVDLFNIGRTRSGARLYGFTPGANLGSSISGVGDFDQDGVADFVVVAQFANPRNFGLVGEAYLLYGQSDTRFGGEISANSVGGTISGVIFEGPPVRENPFMTDGFQCVIPGEPRSDGISHVSFIRDLTGDGRPEILFGLQHVHGAFDGMDYDPADQDRATSGDDGTTDIEVRISQGSVTVEEDTDGAQTVSTTFAGVEEVTLDELNPTVSFGSEGDIRWLNNGPGERKWALIRFRDVLEQLPDSLFGTDAFIDLGSITATLEVRVFDSGAVGEVFELAPNFVNFAEQVTFAGFDNNNPPALGVHYLAEAGQAGGSLGQLDAATPGTVTVDVTRVIQNLILNPFIRQDVVAFIIVAGDDNPADEAAVRSSEFANVTDRPVLEIEYERVSLRGAVGCYPDNLVNNKSDDSEQDDRDQQYYAGGMVILMDSGNRDNSPRLSPMPDRLDTTSIALELVGQEGQDLSSDAIDGVPGDLAPENILPRADNFTEEGRIAGARFHAGLFDCVDADLLNQSAREGLFGAHVASIGDLNNDTFDEIVISAPTNEAYLQDLEDAFGPNGTHLVSTVYTGSIVILPGRDYNAAISRERNAADDSNSTTPRVDHFQDSPFGRCQPAVARGLFAPDDEVIVFAEDVNDRLGGAESAGDFNQDGIADLLCGAPNNDRSDTLRDTGAAYIIYGRSVIGDFDLKDADDPLFRPPMLRIRGVSPGDRIGWRQTTGLDVNGDRLDDVFISSPFTDFGGVTRSTCGPTVVDLAEFSNCRDTFADRAVDLFSDDFCKRYDFDNDGDIDADDQEVFDCRRTSDGSGLECCDNLVDNGFVGIIFGGVFTDGDRTINQLADANNRDLAGVIFFGAATGHRAGYDVSSAGDFNQDGFGDILISVPGEVRIDKAGRQRLGVVYLIFGGTHLENTRWSLDQVGSEDLPGIVFFSPYTLGGPNEAPPLTVAFIGDINRDGFGDICIGNPAADFIDFSFPQGPDATDAELGRRRNTGDAYIIYGNNFGSNRATP